MYNNNNSLLQPEILLCQYPGCRLSCCALYNGLVQPYCGNHYYQQQQNQSRNVALSPPNTPPSGDVSLKCQGEACQAGRYRDPSGRLYPYCAGQVCAANREAYRRVASPSTSSHSTSQTPQPYTYTHTVSDSGTSSQSGSYYTTGTTTVPKCRTCSRDRMITANGIEFEFCGGNACLGGAPRPQNRLLPPALVVGGGGTTVQSNPIPSNTDGYFPKKCAREGCNNDARRSESFCNKACYWLEVATLKETKLSPLEHGDLDYFRISDRFLVGLRNATIIAIIRLQMPKHIAERHLELRKRMAGGFQTTANNVTHRMYHGTSVLCGPLSIVHTGKLCSNSGCGMCGITRNGIKVERSKYQGVMSFTNNPMIASHYTGQNKTKAIFIVDVLAEPYYRNAECITITDDRAALPRFLIIYE